MPKSKYPRGNNDHIKAGPSSFAVPWPWPRYSSVIYRQEKPPTDRDYGLSFTRVYFVLLVVIFDVRLRPQGLEHLEYIDLRSRKCYRSLKKCLVNIFYRFSRHTNVYKSVYRQKDIGWHQGGTAHLKISLRQSLSWVQSTKKWSLIDDKGSACIHLL